MVGIGVFFDLLEDSEAGILRLFGTANRFMPTFHSYHTCTSNGQRHIPYHTLDRWAALWTAYYTHGYRIWRRNGVGLPLKTGTS